MNAGFKGTFVVSWAQTEVDGLDDAPLSSLRVGASWSWFGAMLRVDGSNQFLVLDQSVGETELRLRAARSVQKFIKYAGKNTRSPDEGGGSFSSSLHGFIVTNGAQIFTITLLEMGVGKAPLVVFSGAIPPKGQELWIVESDISNSNVKQANDLNESVICFTPGTRILTSTGQRLVEDLRQGDLVQTKDNGVQPVEWVGRREIGGSQLYASPHLRPVRIMQNSFGDGEPDHELTVSPFHKLLVRGRTAQALFNTDEVLVCAKDLIDGKRVFRDVTSPAVSYIHVLLPRHEILFANGVETESFHPGDASLGNIDLQARRDLSDLFPGVLSNPSVYGAHARRNLNKSEAAILMYGTA